MVEEKSKTSGRGMVVSHFKRRIVFASEVRVEAEQLLPFACCAVNGDFCDPAKADIKGQREEYVVRSIQRLADRGFCIGGLR